MHTTSYSTLIESMLYRFRVIVSYLSKVANFNPPHLHLVPPLGMIQFEFHGALWQQKPRVPGVCVNLGLAVLIQYRE